MIVIFFGVCSGFALWLTIDFPKEVLNIETDPQYGLETDFEVETNLGKKEFNFATSKKILYYTPRYNIEDWNIGQGNEPFSRQVCRVQNCYLTSNKSLLPNMEDFDAVLFHISGINQDLIYGLKGIKRSSRQRYVFSASAPPQHGKFALHEDIK